MLSLYQIFIHVFLSLAHHVRVCVVCLLSYIYNRMLTICDYNLDERIKYRKRKKMTARSVVMGSHHRREKKTSVTACVMCPRQLCNETRALDARFYTHMDCGLASSLSLCLHSYSINYYYLCKRTISVHHYNGSYNIYSVTVLIRYILSSLFVRWPSRVALFPFFLLILFFHHHIFSFIATITQSSLELHPCV